MLINRRLRVELLPELTVEVTHQGADLFLAVPLGEARGHPIRDGYAAELGSLFFKFDQFAFDQRWPAQLLRCPPRPLWCPPLDQ